jgi:hypothetical protein
MKLSVKKFDLLAELNLTQGVVERKTTIPILATVTRLVRFYSPASIRPLLDGLNLPWQPEIPYSPSWCRDCHRCASLSGS